MDSDSTMASDSMGALTVASISSSALDSDLAGARGGVLGDFGDQVGRHRLV